VKILRPPPGGSRRPSEGVALLRSRCGLGDDGLKVTVGLRHRHAVRRVRLFLCLLGYYEIGRDGRTNIRP